MESMDYTTFFLFNIRVFRSFGYWKQDSNNGNEKLYIVYSLFCKLMWAAFMVSQFIYLCINLNHLKEILSTSYFIIPLFIGSIVFQLLYRKMESIKLLLKNLSEPMFQPKCKEHFMIATSLKQSYNTFSQCINYLGMQTTFLLLILPYWQEEQAFPVKLWYPFEWEPSPNFEIIWIFQIVTLIGIINMISCITAFSTGLFILIGLQCDYLSITLSSLNRFYTKNGVLVERKNENTQFTSKTFSDVMLENLIMCIRHYTEIRRITLELDGYYKESIFIQFLTGAAMISSVLFTLSTVTIGSMESLMLMSFSISILVMIFMYCWSGQIVIDKSSNIFKSTYNTPWVECNIKFRKVLLQFMTMTKKPIEIKILGLIVMSYAVFTSIIKSTYSVLNLLHNVQQ